MKNRNPNFLSFESIDSTDLQRLLDLAREDREDFFRRHSEWKNSYANRILGTALCQGAALHYLYPDRGINDFDVYTFYAAHPQRRWYAKRIKSVDFGDDKFGRSEISNPLFTGRRVDLMARSLPVEPNTSIVDALRDYLSNPKTQTACELAEKAVILLEPELGMVVWPIH